MKGIAVVVLALLARRSSSAFALTPLSFAVAFTNAFPSVLQPGVLRLRENRHDIGLRESLRRRLGGTRARPNNEDETRGEGSFDVGFDNVEDPGDEDDPVKSLFAWISLAVRGDPRYDAPLPLAVAACFGSPPLGSEPYSLVRDALSALSASASKNAETGEGADRAQAEEHHPFGASFTLEERENNSLGPLGAAQWEGHPDAMVIPHSIMTDVRKLTSVEEWESSLPRTCRQNVRRGRRSAVERGWVVRDLPIRPAAMVGSGCKVAPMSGNEDDQDESFIAPHSTLSHFRCVVEHELRLATQRGGTDGEFENEVEGNRLMDALCEAAGRFVGTTRMAGSIREYRSPSVLSSRSTSSFNDCPGRVVAFLHSIRKGSVVRGQWFYATDEAARNFAWFDAVWELVRRAVEEKGEGGGVGVVDLGPNGSDGQTDAHKHAAFKRRYGFETVERWEEVADYQGKFW